MRLIVAIILSAAAATAAAAQSVEQLPASAFGRLPNVQSVALSPDGTKLAMIAGSSKAERSIIVRALDGSEAHRIPANEERPLAVNWWSNSRISVAFQKLQRERGGNLNFEETRLLVMDVDGGNQREINPPVQPRNLLLDDERHVLVVGGAQDARTTRSGLDVSQRADIYRLNIETGRARPIHIGREGTSNWVLDHSGEPIARIDTTTEMRSVAGEGTMTFDVEVRNVRYVSRIAQSGEWGVIFDGRVSAGGTAADDVGGTGEGVLEFNPAGLSEDGTKLYLTGRMDGDLSGLHEMVLVTGEITRDVFVPDNADFGTLLIDRYTRKPLGVQYTYLDRERILWDEQLAGIQAALEQAFPDSIVGVNNWDQARTRFVVRIRGGSVADNYYLYDGATGGLSLIARAFPEVPDDAVNPVEYVEYTARDGLTIPAYLTMPRGRAPENLPMIMLPHGGPEARDNPGFDFWSQFLAHRGYVVMQPQFRHSDGFGKEFARKGYGEWGGAMQDDLTDGVQYLVDRGIVDADRVCIFGWSYGGFAAAAGGTLTPEVYRCVITGAPVTDFTSFINWVRDRAGAGSDVVGYWEQVMGDRFTDRERLVARSPLRNVDQVRAPILIQHGAVDTIVPPEQGEMFHRALLNAGKTSELELLEGENHNLLYAETRTQQLETMDDFLKRHNPAY